VFCQLLEVIYFTLVIGSICRPVHLDIGEDGEAGGQGQPGGVAVLRLW